MKLGIFNKYKKDLFVALFQTLRNCSSLISIIFRKDGLHIQGMDKSHICLFEANIRREWFDEYETNIEHTLHVDSNIFYNIINHNQDKTNLFIMYSVDDPDNLLIDILSSGKNNTVFDKHFKLPLVEYENEVFQLPDLEYDAEFSIPSKNICDILSQMSLFGDVVNFKCNDDGIHILTNGLSGEMLVKLPINEITEYSVVEEEEIDVSYSLSYINKMILTNKLSTEIEFCLIKDAPMKVKYSLDNDSYLIFYIAPKIC